MSAPPFWKSAEEIVAFIEASIDPSATVIHDVKLPVIGLKRKRQCDVIIRYGTEPRSLFFIVEVQKRGRKVELGAFQSWVKKMEDVGASGLICVSQEGFPQSVIEQVELKIGPKVKLLTLKPNDSNLDWRGLFVPQMIMARYISHIRAIYHPVLKEEDSRDPVNLNVNLSENVISTSDDPSHLLSVEAYIQRIVENLDYGKKLPSGGAKSEIVEHLLVVSTEDHSTYLHTDEGIFRVLRWKFVVDIRRVEATIPLTQVNWNYVQEFHDDSMAWIATAVLDLPGTPQELRMVSFPDGEGRFKTTIQTKPLAAQKKPVDEMAMKNWFHENNVSWPDGCGVLSPMSVSIVLSREP